MSLSSTLPNHAVSLSISLTWTTRLLQVALTEELLGEDAATATLRFSNHGRLRRAHIGGGTAADTAAASGPPSTWPVCGDSIPILQTITGHGAAAFLPKVVANKQFGICALGQYSAFTPCCLMSRACSGCVHSHAALHATCDVRENCVHSCTLRRA